MTDQEKPDVIEDISEEEALDSISLKVDNPEALIEKPAEDIDEEKLSEEDYENKVQELYDEFNAFIEKTTDNILDYTVKDTVSTGIDLIDAILGGGFAIGALNIIVGQPGSGKSMLAMQTMAQGQRQFKGKLLTSFLDSEEATTEVRLANLGVRYPRVKPYSDITVEKMFQFLESVCVFKHEKGILETPSIIIWDSIANTLSQKERETEDINSVIGYRARLLSILIPKYVAKCSKHNICLLAVNQLRDVLAMGQFAPAKDLKFMSQSKDMPGGNTLKFNAFQLIEVKIKTVIGEKTTEKAENYGFEGIIVSLKCVKNKLFPPNISIDVVGSFVTGFSNFWTNYNFLKTTKRLNAGAWNYLISYPEKKFRTKDAPELYKTDDTFREKFDEAAKEAIKTEIIDKYNPEIE